MGNVSSLFDADRVAVVGASEQAGSIGRAIMENLLADFTGTVVPVNPNYAEVMGRDCVAEIAEAGAVDLAVVAVPAHTAVEEVREAAVDGVENVVVISAGFSEAGSNGAARERELREIANEYDLNLVGPNCLGIISTPSGLNATFGPTNARPGSISFLSQSGAFITAVLDWAKEQDIGFKNVVSLGNKAVLDETDFVAAWGDDHETDVIIGYLESIEDGRAFIERARQVTRSTPIVLVKSGRTDAGAQAASSHTGAIAGSDAAYEAGLDQAGVLRVDTVQALFDFARALAGQPLPESRTVGIVTNAGGPGVMTTDALGATDLELASFSEETVAALRASLPDEANVYNPVDVVGDADLERFHDGLDTVLGDPGVGAVVILSAPTAVLSYDELAEMIVDRQAAHGKPVVTCLMGGGAARVAEDRLRPAGIPNYFDPARAVQSLEALGRYDRIRERTYDDPSDFAVDRERARAILESAAERGDTRIGVEAMELLEAYGIPTPNGFIVDTPAEAASAARDLGGPVVMKIVSPDISHKSDIGGVKVGVAVEEVEDAFEDLVTRARNYQPDASLLGVQVQETVDLDGGTETIVGMNRDPQFGPLVMFGIGGIFVEIVGDTAFRVAPVSNQEAVAMTREIEGAPLLRGARGREPVDVEGIVETIQRVSQLAIDFPAILELDINPLVGLSAGVTAIDVRLTVDTDKL